jgi:hypothetical protein
MKRRAAVLIGLAAGLVLGPSAAAYLELGALAGGHVVPVRWAQMPVKYFVTNRDVPNVTAVQLQAAVQRAFDTWHNVPTAIVSATFGGFTSADPFVDDSVSIIGFRSRPDLDRTLAATTFQLDAVTGRLIESDIFVNSSFDWSVAANGEPQRYDVQAILTHEIGHLHGLGHSALGETELRAGGGRSILGKDAVMFPIAYPAGNIMDRTLKPDDIAGISDNYGTGQSGVTSGQISGKVTQNGAGIFGAHIVAFNTISGTLVGGFSLTAQGTFVISRLEPGVYVVRVEPLDDVDVSSFFDETAPVSVNFKPTYYEHLVSVPAGGGGAPIEIKVTAK